jgi:hypothetical protein
MKRSGVTYGQLDQVLRSLSFSCHPAKEDPPARVYPHQKTGAMIRLPAVVDNEMVFEYHLASVRGELDNFGIAEPTTLAARLQKAS